MTPTLIRDVSILTLDENDRFIERGFLLLSGDRIEQVGEGDPPPFAGVVRRIDGSGKLAVPGLINAHGHSQSATLPGFGDRLSHPAFMWLTQAHTARRTPDETRLAVLLTAWAAMSSGTTAIIDHFPGQRFAMEDVEAVLSAWQETGMRVALGLRFFDGGFDDIFPAPGILPDALLEQLRQVSLLRPQPLGELQDLLGNSIRAWHRKSGRLSVFPAPSNPDRCTDAALQLCAELAQIHDTGLHTHLLETEKQARGAIRQFGMTSLARLKALGVLSDRWSFAHCCWVDREDIGLLADSGAVAVLNPESNARLGSGQAPVPALRDAGVRLALGTDGAGANDNLSMQEAMRAVATLHRASQPGRAEWVSARQALAMATAGGAQALRTPMLGALAPGWLADIALYRLDAPAWLPVNDPVSQLVFAETGASVDTVIVGGRTVLDRGRPCNFDSVGLAAEIRAMARSLRLRNADLFAVADAIVGHIH